MDLETVKVMCPYCGETVEIDVEPLEEAQSFVEDCSVCCRPIQVEATPSEDGMVVVASRSD
jgi:endogenous inhibitor of DNA gyrase (YacG/DUF329 family)